MTITVSEISQQNKKVRRVLNSILSSVKVVVPIEYTTNRPKTSDNEVHLEFGVLVGMTGDLRGKFLFTGKKEMFGMIGEAMFGSALSNEMLHSFCGELGNMIAGSLSTIIAADGVNISITTPTIMSGDTSLTGFKHGIEMPIEFTNIGVMTIHFLLV